MPAAGALPAGLVLSPGVGWSPPVAGDSVPRARPIGLPSQGAQWRLRSRPRRQPSRVVPANKLHAPQISVGLKVFQFCLNPVHHIFILLRFLLKQGFTV